MKNDNNVDELIKKVGLDDVINQFPKKSSQPLTKNLYDDGEELSGGQWQRIAIARCLNRVNASVYLFDEASAALDPLSEKDIYDTIKEISNKKIIIFITHRLSNMDIFDEVYMFKDGVLIEQGSHERLVEANSEYAKYYVFQKKKFEKGVQNEEN